MTEFETGISTQDFLDSVFQVRANNETNSHRVANSTPALNEMPPKYVTGRKAPKGYFASTYETLTSAENASVVKSIAAFGVSNIPSPLRGTIVFLRTWPIYMLTTMQVAVAFLSSNWAEYILVLVSPESTTNPGTLG